MKKENLKSNKLLGGGGKEKPLRKLAKIGKKTKNVKEDRFEDDDDSWIEDWSKRYSAKSEKKSKSQKLIDKISQSEFGKNYNELSNIDKDFVNDAYSSIQASKYMAEGGGGGRKNKKPLKEDRFEDVEHIFSGEPDPEFAEITPFKDDIQIWKDNRRELMTNAEVGIDQLLTDLKEQAYDLGGDTNGPGIWFDIKRIIREKL